MSDWKDDPRSAIVSEEDLANLTTPPRTHSLPTSPPTSLPNSPTTRLGIGRGVYPWAKWSDGRWHTITKHQDFTVSPATIVNQLHNYARRREMVASTETSGDKVTFRFFKSAADRERILTAETREAESQYADVKPDENGIY